MDMSVADAGLSPMQQQKMVMDYLAAVNNSQSEVSIQPTAVNPLNHQQNQDLQDLLAANGQQLMENMFSAGGLGGAVGSANNNNNNNNSFGDLFTNMANTLMNPSGLLSPSSSAAGVAMNSTFHKEFLKQIANVQKEQGIPTPAGVQTPPVKRRLGRPPGRPPSDRGPSANGASPMANVSIGGASPRFACDYCHKTFASRYYLATHIQVHLSQLSPDERKEQMQLISSPEQLRLIERAEERQRFLQHGQKSSPVMGGGVGGAVDDSQRPANYPRFKCVKCVACFNDEEEFKQHLAAHVGDRPVFHCQKCNKTYKYEGAFESHRCIGKIGE